MSRAVLSPTAVRTDEVFRRRRVSRMRCVPIRFRLGRGFAAKRGERGLSPRPLPETGLFRVPGPALDVTGPLPRTDTGWAEIATVPTDPPRADDTTALPFSLPEPVGDASFQRLAPSRLAIDAGQGSGTTRAVRPVCSGCDPLPATGIAIDRHPLTVTGK